MKNQQLIKMMEDAVELTGVLGLKITEFKKGAVAVHSENNTIHQNHMQSMHAGVMYCVAELAAGCSITVGLFDDFDRLFFALKEGNIQYLSVAKNPVTAKGELAADVIDAEVAKVLQGESVDIAVPVILTDEVTGKNVGHCVFTYTLKPLSPKI